MRKIRPDIRKTLFKLYKPFQNQMIQIQDYKVNNNADKRRLLIYFDCLLLILKRVIIQT